jgi:4-amino-4-deoxy-L-arabinose transferase-like glycosyltransferase
MRATDDDLRLSEHGRPALPGGAAAVQLSQRTRHLRVVVLVGVLAVAALLRLWDIQIKPGFDWDEPVYTSVGANVALHGLVQVKNDITTPTEPYLYHPPFYFLLLGGWFKLFGIGVGHARILAALMSLAGLAILYRFLREEIGDWALLVIGLVGTDGWMVFSNRISWLENTMMPLGMLGLWAYSRAVRGNAVRPYLLAGLLLGFTAIFKHVGVYFALAAALEALLLRRFHRGIVVAGVAVLATAVVYVACMLAIFRSGGHSYFADETLVQIQRTLGAHEARGSITGPTQVVNALLGQYRIFVGTLVISLAAGLIWLVSTVRAIRGRSLAPLGRHPLLYCWFTGAILFLGAIQLKFPHYYQMMLVPMYAYVGAALHGYVARRPPMPRPRMLLGAGALAILLAVNGVTFWDRIAGRNDNALAAVSEYAAPHLPARAVVLTEETIGTIIKQPYCKMFRVQTCPASYIITYTSNTQRPPDIPLLHRLIAEGTKLAVFQGFKEQITVYRVPGGVQ